MDKMKIAYVIQEVYALAPLNGIRTQAEMWASELERQGHTVIKVNPWEKHIWSEYDIIHIFGPLFSIYAFTSEVFKENKNVFYSPIIDTIQPIWRYRLASLWGIMKLRLTSPNYLIRKSRPYIKQWVARSHYEYSYIHKAYGVPSEKISIIPLSYNIKVPSVLSKKENFCFHLSIITDERKNVIRLIKAAIKFKFRLVLAGSVGDKKKFEKIKELIRSNPNIEYIGKLSDDELVTMYSKAKVFALPSINEGVGMVALEAAIHGCNIVVTRKGGPKEYYNGKAWVVNPYSVDEIGNAVVCAMHDNTVQPALRNTVIDKYNIANCVNKLIYIYK